MEYIQFKQLHLVLLKNVDYYCFNISLNVYWCGNCVCGSICLSSNLTVMGKKQTIQIILVAPGFCPLPASGFFVGTKIQKLVVNFVEIFKSHSYQLGDVQVSYFKCYPNSKSPPEVNSIIFCGRKKSKT